MVELRKLFQDMITSDMPQVTPNQELARLTLLSSSTEEIFRRRSTLSGVRPNLGELNGQAIQGPALPPGPRASVDSMTIAGDKPIDLGGNMNAVSMSDGVSSEGTLVEKPTTPADNEYLVIDSQEKEHQDEMLEDKENILPTKEGIRRPLTPESPPKLLAESSLARVNEQGSSSPPKQSIETDEPVTLESPFNNIGGPRVALLPCHHDRSQWISRSNFKRKWSLELSRT